MANSISLATEFIPLLDEVYKEASLTSVLDGASELVQQGANANELIIPKIDMAGLADYSRNSGYVDGDVTLTNESVKCNFDRGRMFSVDSMDDIETAGIAFGQLAGEFIRTKVTPELDAFRFASYAGASGADLTAGAYTDGKALIKAIATKADGMTDAEVPQDGRYLFITAANYGLIRDMDTTASRALIESFAGVIVVPGTRFYTAIEQTDNGYQKATDGKALNFLIVHKDAVIQFEKHVAPKIVTPEANPDADAWKFGYRNVSIADVYENKTAGIAGEYTA